MGAATGLDHSKSEMRLRNSQRQFNKLSEQVMGNIGNGAPINSNMHHSNQTDTI